MKTPFRPRLSCWQLYQRDGAGVAVHEIYRTRLELPCGELDGIYELTPPESGLVLPYKCDMYWHALHLPDQLSERQQELATQLLCWYPLPPTGCEPLPDNAEKIGEHTRLFQDGRTGTFNSIEEFVGALLLCDHWPPSPTIMEQASWLLIQRSR